MKLFPLLVVLFSAGLASLAVRAQNQFFQSGSTGADGAFAPTTNNTNVLLPPDGRLNFTTVNIPSTVTVRFIRNAANTPVYLLATGTINIAGNIRVDGELGTATTGGRGGPGGFDGGMPGIAGSLPGDGLGPGGGRGALIATNAGRGIYGVNISTNLAASQRMRPGSDGSIYGSQLLMPLVGGSGGGGHPGLGGGGGGGAILIASSVAITNTGTVIANGAGSRDQCGSGGAIRLVAPLIAGSGGLQVYGGGTFENAGRIRCDLIERQQFGLTFTPASAPVTASEAFMVTFPPNIPSLRLVSVAGVPVPPDAPAGFTVTLPFNAPAAQPIVLEASGFGVEVPVAIRLTPAIGSAGPPIPVTINNVAPGSAQTTVNATFPPNVPVFVEAWTR